MVESLINATVAALRKPENATNGINDAIFKFLKPAMDPSDFASLRNKTTPSDTDRLLHEVLDDYLTGEPDLIEELTDILDRQDGPTIN